MYLTKTKAVTFMLYTLVMLPSLTYALSSDKQKTAHLTADNVKYDRLNHQSMFTGHVQFHQGTTTLTADKILVYDNKHNKVYKVIATGKRAHYSTLPDAKKFLLHAKANTIVYYPIKEVAMLIGNGEIQQQQNIFSGPHITYNVRQQVITSTPSQHQQTSITIQP